MHGVKDPSRVAGETGPVPMECLGAEAVGGSAGRGVPVSGAGHPCHGPVREGPGR